MNPKSGKAGTPVAPSAPKNAQDADSADPGEVEQIKAQQAQTQSGKYGAAQFKPHRPPQTDEERETRNSWIAIKLVDEENHPIPGERYAVILPDGGTLAEGTLDEKGEARVEGIEPGTCEITFPDLDRTAWHRQ